MDDEGGVKVPVTRLRRRLSVEQSEEVKSSPAANTPTKKRGGRRAAKPELDLIDENVPDNNTSKRTTRKTAVKELEDVEEKPLTPSRRSARIRSNTSIVSENTQTFDSPRAKRVARRTSQVGSDNEAVLTPVRQTRRTRKDSTSNVENAEPLPVKPTTGIIVEEETESSQKIQKSPIKNIEQNHSPTGSRKSPRLSLKKNKNSKTELNVSSEIVETTVLQDNNSSNKENETSPEKPAVIKENHSINASKSNVEKKNLSESSSELLQKLKTEPNKKTPTLNKSASAITDNLEFKSKRHRTKSWTTLSTPVLNDNILCFSDSESIKKKGKSTLNNSNHIHLENSSKTQKNNLSLKKKKDTLQDDSAKKLQLDLLNTSNQIEKDEILTHSVSSTNAEAVTSLFEKEPSTVLKTTIFIEETDSNSEKNHKLADDDQCVPEVQPQYKEESKNDIQVNFNCSKDIQEKTMTDNKNNSCEPMDIDETLPDNLSLSKRETSANKESISKDQIMEYSINQGSKKRKSSLTTSTSQVLEKSCNENKSTLVLSQLKDISNDNNVLQASQFFTEKKNADSALDTTQDDNGLERKNSLSAYSTSTPLHQKGLMKLATKINTSDMTSNNTSNIEKSNSKVNKKKSSNISNTSSEQSVSEEESEQEESKLIDDEAEEASEDYESGDSKDEEQEKYEKENEIIQKGETLTSEDELSNDSDYEKDSFVVSSDEEDDDLLDGSGDDLSMSDKELKMTKESKKRYNERKLKEQKKASREMFESRHKINVLKESIKSESLNKKKKRAVIDSSASEDDDDNQVKAKKNNKMRLDSSHETSASKSLNDTQIKGKKNKMRLDSSHEASASKSFNNSCNVQTEAKILSKSIDSKSATNEVEMTICDENSNNEEDPLAVEIKKEPVTPLISNTNVSIQFIDSENTEENEGGKNKSHRNMTHTDDPLEDSNASNSSDSSDNIHIQNYDSVLNELNNSVRNKKNKTANISLNLDKKKKQKATPIVDELNLTQVKTKIQKKTRNKDEVDSKTDNNSSNEKSFAKNKPNIEDNDNESSDSIDIHLLFSEDSNSSENQQINKKINEAETFIPLKKNPGKTNILEISGSKNTTERKKKKNKLEKPLDKTVPEDEKDDVEIHFIMDTTGTHNSTELENSFNINTSLKKIEQSLKDDDDDSVSDTPAEVSNKSFKETRMEESKSSEEIAKTISSMHNKSITKTPKSEKKKREKKISVSLAMNEDDNSYSGAEVSMKCLNETGKGKMNPNKENNAVSSTHNNSITKTPKTEKKNKRNSESLAQDEKDGNSDSDAPAEISNKSFKESEGEKIDTCEEINKIVSSMYDNSIVKTPKSEKKKKRISESSAIGVTDKALNESVANTPAIVKKKKNRLSESQSAEQMHATEISTHNTSAAKKPDALHIEDQNMEKNADADKTINKSLTKTPMSEKKKKKRLSESQSIDLNMNTNESPQECQNIETDKSMNHSVTKTPKGEKKKKKRLSESQSAEQISNEVTTEDVHNNKLNTSKIQVSDLAEESIDSMANKSLAKTPRSEKKKAKTSLNSIATVNMVESDVENSDKKSKKMQKSIKEDNDTTMKENLENISSKKRKRKSSLSQTDGEQGEDNGAQTTPVTLLEPDISEVQIKRRKITHNTENTDQDQNISKDVIAVQKEQRRKNTKSKDFPHNQVDFEKGATQTGNNMATKKEIKKRKQREDDEEDKSAKVQKTNSLDKVNVPRLPTSILNELEENRKKKNSTVSKSKVISTSNFVVEEAKTVKNKPSNYLEESVYLNEDELLESKKQKRIKNPKVLPFLPTVSTSNCGYTTNFKVNVTPKEFKFVAKSSNISNFKNDFLENKKIKRIGTYELYKRNRNVKLSKF